MKAKELAAELLKNPELEVFFQDPNSDGGPFVADKVEVKTAIEDEFPEDFDMPAGFQFILLEND